MTDMREAAARVGPEDAAWSWLEVRYLNAERGDDPNDLVYGADDMVDAFIAGLSIRALPYPDTVREALTKARDVFREYETHHQAKADEMPDSLNAREYSVWWDRTVKATRNRELANLMDRVADDAKSETYAEWQQKRGMLADTVDWAILEYDEFMKDDAYDSQRVLDHIVKRLREVRDITAQSALSAKGGGGER